MNGPEHYRQAERLLYTAADSRTLTNRRADCTARAQVHATLALAAAQVEAVGSRGPGDLSTAWADVVYPGGAS